MIVIDMDMPESCNECPLFDNEYLHCQKTKERCETWAFEPPKSCPIKCDIEQIRAEIYKKSVQMHFDGNFYIKIDEVLQIIDKYAEQEPCDDAISRQAVVNAIKYAQVNFTINSTINFANYTKEVQAIVDNILSAQIKAINELPSVRPQEQTGHWEWLTEDKYRCSNCNHETRVDECMNKPMYDFCPFCNARMVEPRESEEEREGAYDKCPICVNRNKSCQFGTFECHFIEQIEESEDKHAKL